MARTVREAEQPRGARTPCRVDRWRRGASAPRMLDQGIGASAVPLLRRATGLGSGAISIAELVQGPTGYGGTGPVRCTSEFHLDMSSCRGVSSLSRSSSIKTPLSGLKPTLARQLDLDTSAVLPLASPPRRKVWAARTRTAIESAGSRSPCGRGVLDGRAPDPVKAIKTSCVSSRGSAARACHPRRE